MKMADPLAESNGQIRDVQNPCKRGVSAELQCKLEINCGIVCKKKVSCQTLTQISSEGPVIVEEPQRDKFCAVLQRFTQ